MATGLESSEASIATRSTPAEFLKYHLEETCS